MVNVAFCRVAFFRVSCVCDSSTQICLPCHPIFRLLFGSKASIKEFRRNLTQNAKLSKTETGRQVHCTVWTATNNRYAGPRFEGHIVPRCFRVLILSGAIEEHLRHFSQDWVFSYCEVP